MEACRKMGKSIFGKGNPHREIIYRSFYPKRETIKCFANLGVDLICVGPANTLNSIGTPYSAYPPNWIHKGVYDWEIVDKQFDDLIAGNENAQFICLIDLNTPAWAERWCREHEDSFYNLGKVAASENWRKTTDEYLEAFLAHTEGKYSHKIVAYVLMCGRTDEWQDASDGVESPSRLLAWRKWCVVRGYPEPRDIPQKSVRDASSHGLLKDPVLDAETIRYWDFSRWLIADAILHFAGKTNAATKHRATLGIFYGYVMEHGQGYLLSTGHLAFDKIFASDEIDFIISPSSYQDREMGGSSSFMLPVGSLKLHGKGFIREIDHYTHTANGNPLAVLGVKEDHMSWQNRWPDEVSSIAGLRREFTLDLTAGHSFWWFDMWNHWYETDGIISTLASLRKIWREQTGEDAPNAKLAQIVLCVDSESCLYLNQLDKRINDVLYGLRCKLGRVGAPYSVISFADIEMADFSKCKLLIFPNLFLCDSERAGKIKSLLMKDGRTILWIHKAGAIDGNTYDESNIECLTGIKFQEGHVARKDFAEWKSVLHSDLLPSVACLREIAREAGAHIYSETEDPVYATENLLAAHTATGGKRKFRLPRKFKEVRELFSERVVARDCDKFEDVLSAPDTVLYKLEG